RLPGFGQLYGAQRLKGPVATCFFNAWIGHVRTLRPGQPLIDPRAKQPDFFGIQRLTSWRHHDVLVQAGHEMDQPTVRTVMLDEGRAVAGPFDGTLPDAEVQSPLFITGGMALETARAKQRLHVFDEV